MVHTIIIPRPVGSVDASVKVMDSDRERLHRQMLSSVSHDLKTPIASIIGSLEVYERMKDRLPEDKKSALLRVALQESYRLDNFVTNILDMAKLENGMVKATRRKIDIGVIVQDCLVQLEHRMKDCAVDISGDTLRDIVTDNVLLGRAIYLVLDNAIKYGGTPPHVHIYYGQTDACSLVLEIRDNGQGIPPERQEHIFSKYTRFPKTDQQNAGTGLGLPICRAIMNLLSGTITATSHPAGGAVFMLRLPVN